MKILGIPTIDGLEAMNPELLRETLERCGARDVIDIASWEEKFPYKPDVSFAAAASTGYLFVNFKVSGLGLKAEFSETNEPVWQDSCVEFFAADPDGKSYRNFEINCIGTLLSARQKAKGVDVEQISREEAAKVIRHASLPHEAFSEKEGLHSWTLTIGIPWELLGYDSAPESLRVNFYKCADGSRWPHYLCWSPIDTPEPDFHRPEFFGKLEINR